MITVYIRFDPEFVKEGIPVKQKKVFKDEDAYLEYCERNARHIIGINDTLVFGADRDTLLSILPECR